MVYYVSEATRVDVDLEPDAIPLPITKRRASMELIDTPYTYDYHVRELQARNEILKTTHLLRLGLEQLKPLLELTRV